MMDKLYFSIAGIPETTPKPVDIFSGLKRIKEMGIDGIELEFVHSIWLKEDKAAKVKETAEELGLKLTIHAPYYINLNSPDNKIKYGSIGRIFDSAYIGSLAGVYSATFHPGYYLKDTPEEASQHIRYAITKIAEKMEKKNISNIYVRPETTGRVAQWGTLEEILELSKEFDFCMPCIDFAHIFARSNGQINTEDDFKRIIEQVYKALGDKGLNNMHIHYSGIEYSIKGERKHLPLEESENNYKGLMKVLKESGIKGVLVCESPIRDTDTLLLKETYEQI